MWSDVFPFLGVFGFVCSLRPFRDCKFLRTLEDSAKKTKMRGV